MSLFARRSVVRRTEPQPNPWIIFTCGPMGVGKVGHPGVSWRLVIMPTIVHTQGYTLYWLSANGYFPLENIVHVDPDHFKRCMPEVKRQRVRLRQRGSTHSILLGMLASSDTTTSVATMQRYYVGQWEHYVARDKEKAGVHCHRE